MIELKAVTIRRGGRVLLEQATGVIYAGDKLGLVGRNGCGKSTLLAMLRGQLNIDSGEVIRPPNFDYAYLEQEIPSIEVPAIEYVKSGDQQLFTLINRLSVAEQQQNYELITNIHNRLYELDADKLPMKAARIMVGLGFNPSELANPVNSFSGGWRMRLNLAKVLISNATLLLLDEPTNYLDIEAIWWLEGWLRNFTGTIIVISHDRDFLDRVVNRIWAIHQQKLEQYSGNYSDYQQQRLEHIEQQQHAWRNQQNTIKHLNSYIERFRSKATKARQAQSRLKLLEKMEQVEVLRQESPYNFSFGDITPGGTPLLKLISVDLGYPGHIVLPQVKLTIHPHDRVAILGANGAGKSTLLRSIAGIISPIQGEIKYGHKVRMGYFAQHQMDQFDITQNSYQLIQDLDQQISEQRIRSYLGGFGFTGNRDFEPISNYSGGEKARFTLAWLIWQQPNLLLLDEPTNHLDLEMREALAYALQSYNGALLLVAHDRYLLDSSVDIFYEIYQGKLSPWTDSLEHYYEFAAERRRKEHRINDKEMGHKTSTRDGNNTTNNNYKERQNQLKRLEVEIAQLEQQIGALNTKLQQPGITVEDLTKHSQYLTQLGKELAIREDLWYQLAEQNSNN